MADQPDRPIPFPPQHVANLTHALRTQTNAILEVKASLAVIAERLDRLIDAERTEADDIREIRRVVVDAGKEASEAKHAAMAAKHAANETREASGPIVLHTPEQFEALVEAKKKPGALEALGVLAERVGKLPTLVKWFLGTGIGGALVEAAHRFFHF